MASESAEIGDARYMSLWKSLNFRIRGELVRPIFWYHGEAIMRYIDIIITDQLDIALATVQCENKGNIRRKTMK